MFLVACGATVPAPQRECSREIEPFRIANGQTVRSRSGLSVTLEEPARLPSARSDAYAMLELGTQRDTDSWMAPLRHIPHERPARILGHCVGVVGADAESVTIEVQTTR